ncbi:MAG TPA: hypothetical protein VM348_13175 [Brevundimonas sp.]|nr:hypothetical protein [Brevundimonas sp.]
MGFGSSGDPRSTQGAGPGSREFQAARTRSDDVVGRQRASGDDLTSVGDANTLKVAQEIPRLLVLNARDRYVATDPLLEVGSGGALKAADAAGRALISRLTGLGGP